jgi:hypothetical protein
LTDVQGNKRAGPATATGDIRITGGGRWWGRGEDDALETKAEHKGKNETDTKYAKAE